MDNAALLPQIISVNADGTPCFTGTNVPARALIDYLEKGYTIYEFLVGFPTVRRQQAIAFLELATSRLLTLTVPQ